MLSKTDVELSAIASVYLRHHSERNEADFWAFEEVVRIVQIDFHQAWTVTRLLVGMAGSDEALSYVAAGPLEDFVDGYGDAALDQVEAACREDERMQYALSGIWLEQHSPVLIRWRGLMARYGFLGGERQSLSWHPDCWL